MRQLIPILVIVAGLAVLFYRDRKAPVRTSAAVWIPILWMTLISSRPLTEWTPAKAWEYVSSTQFAEGSPINAFVFAALSVAALLVLNWRAARVRAFVRVNAPVLVFFAYCVASILWSGFMFVTMKRCIKAVGEFLIIAVVLTDPRPQLAVRRFLVTPAMILLPMSVLLILFFPDLGTYSGTDGRVFYAGVATHKNTLGVACLVHGIACLWCWLNAYSDHAKPHRQRDLILYGALYLTALGLILRANSMTSFVSLVAASVFMLIGTRRSVVLQRSFLHALIALLVFAPLLTILLDTTGVMAHSLGRQASLSGRTEIWNAVLSININPLLGTGFESFWLGNRVDQVWSLIGQGERGIQEAHNGYIELYLNLGWAGLALLAWLLVTGYRSAVAALQHHAHDAVIRLAFIVAALMYSMTEAGFRMLDPIWVLFLLGVTQAPADPPVQSFAFRSVMAGKRQPHQRVIQ
jgi:exopolysaccharide production protein ExoQ